jgi:hypothetical protein
MNFPSGLIVFKLDDAIHHLTFEELVFLTYLLALGSLDGMREKAN